MKVTAKDNMEYGQDLDWCACYKNKDVVYVYANGEIISLAIGEDEYHTTEQIKQNITRAAKLVEGDDYDLYDGYSDEEILLQSSNMDRCGCLECPYCSICDAMQQEVSPSDEVYELPLDLYHDLIDHALAISAAEDDEDPRYVSDESLRWSIRAALYDKDYCDVGFPAFGVMEGSDGEKYISASLYDMADAARAAYWQAQEERNGH